MNTQTQTILGVSDIKLWPTDVDPDVFAQEIVDAVVAKGVKGPASGPNPWGERGDYAIWVMTVQSEIARRAGARMMARDPKAREEAAAEVARIKAGLK